jgi:hypothetical protein
MEKNDEKPKTEKTSKFGFPNIVRKKKIVSIQEIFNDVNIKSKLSITNKDENKI